MPANQDFKDLLSALNAERAEYVIVGAHAVVAYTEPRFTKDLDILVRPDPDNSQRVYRALTKFGAPMREVKAQDFLDLDLIYQIGIAPNRVDILTSIKGVLFEDAFKDSIQVDYDGVLARVMGRAALIRSKKAANPNIAAVEVAVVARREMCNCSNYRKHLATKQMRQDRLPGKANKAEYFKSSILQSVVF